MPWRDGFLKGLTNSRKFVAIVSSSGLKAVRSSYANHTHDNVLLEYQTAFQISAHIQDASYVIPVFVGEYTDGKLKKFSDHDSAMYPNEVLGQPLECPAKHVLEVLAPGIDPAGYWRGLQRCDHCYEVSLNITGKINYHCVCQFDLCGTCGEKVLLS
jgi:hypothetical protein